MDLGLTGKRALVCASSKGMGKAIAKALAKEGARVFMCARNAADLIDAVNEVEAVAQFPVTSMTCDLSEPEQREALIAQVQAAFGVNELDILVHNTGGPKPSRMENTSLQDWQTGFDQLFQSVAHLNQAFLPGMMQKRWGRIICITSLSTFEPIDNLAVSSGIRPAVMAMLKSLANEVARHNITVNCVAPGLIMTDRTEELLKAHLASSPGSTRESWMADYAKSIPAGRLGHPDEFAAPVAFLCSEQAAYITGGTLCIDGGKRHGYH